MLSVIRVCMQMEQLMFWVMKKLVDLVLVVIY